MNTRSTRLTALALRGLLVATLLLAPIHARADPGYTDRHEIPVFVLERIELALDANGRTG